MAARVVEVAHFSGMIASEPLGQSVEFRPVFGARNTAKIKADFAGPPDEPIGARARTDGESHT